MAWRRRSRSASAAPASVGARALSRSRSAASGSGAGGSARLSRGVAMARVRTVGGEPGEHGPPPRVVALGVAPGADEGLLGDVLRRARVAEDGEGEPEDAPLEAAHEGRRRVGVARGEASEERLVRAGHTLT